MATLIQIGESTERANRTARHEDASRLETPEPQAESPSATASRTLLRAVVSALIAPILLAAALVVFLFALADFSWFRLRDLRNGHPHPKGLWEF
jgi:hypothetical protein